MSETTLQVPKDVIEPIIRQHVASAVAQALVGRDELVTSVVHQVLNAKVDREGRQSNYNSDIPWLQWVMGQCVRDAVKDAIIEELANHKEKLKAQIVKDLRNTKSGTAKALANAMVEAFANPETMKWRLSVGFEDR
jgi:hypothetical protein